MTEDWTGNHTFLKRLVIILGVLIVIGLGVVVVTLIKRAQQLAGQTEPSTSEPAARMPDAAPVDFTVPIPEGATIEDTRVKEGRLIVRIRLGPEPAARQQLLIYDLASGKRLATIDLVPAQ